MDDKIVGPYAAGLTVRDIRGHFEDVYGLHVSPDVTRRVTDAVLDEGRDWQRLALERMYPIHCRQSFATKRREDDFRCTDGKDPRR